MFYVALTRAKEHVVVTHARLRTIRGTRERMTPSPYLADIPIHLRGGGQLSLSRHLSMAARTMSRAVNSCSRDL